MQTKIFKKYVERWNYMEAKPKLYLHIRKHHLEKSNLMTAFSQPVRKCDVDEISILKYAYHEVLLV